MNHPEDLKYKIAIANIKAMGISQVKNIVAYVGSVEGVFKEKKKNLLKIPRVGDIIASRIINKELIEDAEQEVDFIIKNEIQPYFYLDKEYPKRLLLCNDAPVLLYHQGNANLNEFRIISMVGTRNASDYGKELCDNFIKELSKRDYPVLVLSGLAYGIDVAAHKACLKYELPTVGVLAHGLDKLYPAIHKNVAAKMKLNGGLLSEFKSGLGIDRKNFLQRNRIVAGMADATIIVESAAKGGALVTADIAASYNRDVFAFPGRTNDEYSKGCNHLIKSHQADMITCLEDLEYIMGWETDQKKPKTIQKQLFVELNDDEKKLVDLLADGEQMIDHITKQLSMPVSKISSTLLSLEFKGLVLSLPGKVYRLCN